MRDHSGNAKAAPRQTKREKGQKLGLAARKAQPRRLPGPLLWRTAILVLMVAAICALTTAGRPAAAPDIGEGKHAPRDVRARADFVDADGRDVRRGELILSSGSVVTRRHLADLHLERQAYRSSPRGRLMFVQRIGGLAVALLVFVTGAAVYVRRYKPDILANRRKAISLVLLTLGVVAMTRYCVVAGVTSLWVPVPLAVMVLSLVGDERLGFAAAVFYSTLVWLAFGGAGPEFFILLAGAVASAFLCGQVRTRNTLIKVGVVTGAVMFCTAWALGVLTELEGAVMPLAAFDAGIARDCVIALTNGVLSGFLVSGLLPGIERLFDVTTDVRLLEWSDPNQPLLQNLLLEAPGTYHHSMVVGGLSADAAESIGANPLLARVSAYFHDVGKLRKPDYFAENLPPGAKNPHDDLSPSMSNLIITTHPKDGADMAEQYGVPEVVRDIILQSHGSGVLSYFWDKVQQDGNGQTGLEERDFRYRLPKPASKEAAIVMLADAAESAGRSLESPSAGQLRNLVHQIILDRLHDGQLDEAGLSTTDLKQLEDSLVHGLAAAFHSRISYPGQEKVGRETPGPAPDDQAGKEDGQDENRDQ